MRRLIGPTVVVVLVLANVGPAWSAFGEWTIVPSPNPAGFENELGAVVRLSATDAWAVGGVTHEGSHQTFGRSRPLVVHWDGVAWHEVPTPRLPPSGGWLGTIAAASPSDVWAAGSRGGKRDQGLQPLIEHFEGSSWSIVPNPSPGPDAWVSGITASGPNDAWAVGTVNTGGDTSEGFAEHWDGSTWQLVPIVPTGSDLWNVNAVEQTSRKDVWLVGEYHRTEKWRAFAEHWDGTSWRLVRFQQVGITDELNAVSASSPTDVWAVGDSLSFGIKRPTMAEHFDGTRWTLVPVPTPPAGVAFDGVSTVSPTDAWAVGSFGKKFGNSVFEHWDGATWTRVDPPFVKHHFDWLTAISAGSDGALSVGFRFVGQHGNDTRTLIEACCS